MSVNEGMGTATDYINQAEKAISTSSQERAQSAALIAIAKLLCVISLRLQSIESTISNSKD